LADSLNPEDKAALNRLDQGLRDLEGTLGKRLRELERGLAGREQQVVREAARGAHEELVRRAEGGTRVTLPSNAEISRFAQGEISAGEAVDRRARQFERISQINLRTSAADRETLSRTERMVALERDLGLQRARNLQIIQRQAQQLGYALPGQRGGGTVAGRTLAAQPGPFDFRAPPPALMLPTSAQLSRDQALMEQMRRVSEGLRGSQLLGGRTLVPSSFGGGGGQPPRRPPAPPAGGGPTDPEDPQRNLREVVEASKLVAQARANENTTLDDYKSKVQGAAEANDELLRAQQKSGASMQQMEARVSEASRTLAIGSNQMRAHGALTTEFITAAAKGQTTFAELGFQVGATIGKFAGWTGAAAAVYGVLGAIQNLGTGAVESLQGVNLLQRVVNNLDTDKAQRNFRGLANEFNLPMSEVVQTTYEASKAFKDQNDALEATRAALFAVKVGELDAGQAGRFATATARGFHLEASKLGDVINTVNALQNRFGGNFGQIAQGMGQAAGAFGAARGNYKQLAAAIATVTQVTGIQGPPAATALRRTSELAFRPERRQGILDVLGVDTQDARTSIADLIDAGIREVEKGRNPLEIAKLITTPELASRAIAPLLASGALYRERLDVAEHPGNSSERELARAKKSIRDQIGMIGNQIEQLGSNLAQSGMLNIFGGLLKGINESLHLANGLLDAFNLLPKPVREAAMYFGQIAAALAVMRRFDVGKTVGTRFPFLGEQLGRRPVSGGRAQILQGLGDERKWLQEQTQSIGRQRALAELQAVRAAQRHDRNVDLHAAGRLTDEELVRSKQRVERLTAQTVDLAEDQADVQQRTIRLNEQERNLRERTNYRQRKNIRTLEDLDKAARAEGILWRNPTLDRNVPLTAAPLGAGRTRVVSEDPARDPARPPIPFQQASARIDYGAYHAATVRELQAARQRAREALTAREQFDLLPTARTMPQERERLVREHQQARAAVEAAHEREQQARLGILPMPSRSVRDLNEWARDHETGEPVAVPPEEPPKPPPEPEKRPSARGLVYDPASGAWVDETGETVKKAEAVTERQNTLRKNIGTATRAAEGLTGEMSRSGAPMERLSKVLGAGGGAMMTGAKGMKNVGTGLASFGRNLVGAIDPITGILAGFLIVEASYSYIKNKVQETNRQVAALTIAARGASPDQLRAHADRELGHRTAFEAVQDVFASGATTLSHLPGGYGRTFRAPNQRRDQAANLSKQLANEIEAANAQGRYMTRAQITAQLNENLRAAGDDQGQISAAFKQAQDETKTARGFFFGTGKGGEATPADVKKAQKNIDEFRQALAARRAGLYAIGESLNEALKVATDNDAIQALLSTVQTNVALYGYTPKRAATLGAIRAKQIEILGGLDRGDPKYEEKRGQAVQNLKDVDDYAVQQAQERLNRSLPYVDVDVAGHLRQQQIATFRREQIGGTENKIAEVRKRIADRARKIARAEREQDIGPPAPRDAGPAGDAGVSKAEDEKTRAYDALTEAQKLDKQKLEALRKSLHMSRQAFADFKRAQDLAQYQAEQAAFETTTGLLQSRTADSSQQAAIALQRATQQLETARRKHAQHLIPREEVQKAETKRNQTAQALAEDTLKDAQANDELATARAQAGGLKDRGLLARQLNDAQRNAARVKAAVAQGKVDPDAYRDALKAVYDAQIAFNDFVKNNGDSLLNALEALALSKTEDPVKQATIRMDYARKRLAEARQSGDKEAIITAQADLNNKVREKRNTVQQRRFDAIEFDSQMETIGKQTEIARLQNLLATMKGQEDLRRQIKLRIHELQKSSNDLTSNDLTLGNIRLPTPYEVNRAIKEGGASVGGHTFNQRNVVNVYVADSKDVDGVAAAVDSTLNTHVRSVLRTRTP
jgi:TP901 family phage tail tape measure protein